MVKVSGVKKVRSWLQSPTRKKKKKKENTVLSKPRRTGEK